MGLAAFYRTKSEVNYFRNTLLSIIENKELSCIVMIYPYFYENKVNSEGKIGNYSILERGGIEKSIKSRDNYTLITCSPQKLVDNENDEWTESYTNFVYKLRKSIEKTNIDYQAYYINSEENFSHSKLCLGYKYINEEWIPVVLLLGSSNLTNRTLDYYPDFNYESDILIWDNSNFRMNIDDFNSGDNNNQYNELKPIFAVEKDEELIKEYLRFFDDKIFNELNANFTEVPQQ